MKIPFVIIMAASLAVCSASAVEVNHVAGEPSEADWEKAAACTLVPANPATTYGEAIVRRCGMDKKVFEATSVRLLWSDQYLYVRFDADDSDIVAQSDKNQSYLYTQGDAVEVFLKPQGFSHYWELYGDVSNYTTCIFIPSRGRLGLPKNRPETPDMKLIVETTLDGTLNDMTDRDKGWAMIMKIPVSGLTRHGASFTAGTPWTFCVVRYNYSVDLPMRERTVYPALTDEPHLYEEFAELVLKNPN